MSRTSRWFWVMVAAQAVFLLGWAGYHENIRHTAPIIRLKGQPVDPQDLLRGDYMTLSYDISRTTRGNENLSTGDEVWVRLVPRDGYHVIGQVSREPLPETPGQLLVRGRVGTRWWGQRAETELVINYGIERFFVPEGKGSPRFKQLEVEASVSAAHRLYLRRVLLDGKAYP